MDWGRRGRGNGRLQVEGRKLKVRKRFPEPAVRATRVGLRELQVRSGELKGAGCRLKVRKRRLGPAARATQVGLREFQLQSGLQGVEFRALVLEGFHSDFVWDLIPIP